MKLSDFLLRLAKGGRIGEGFRHCLASRFASQPKLRLMAGIARLGAMAGWLSTTPNHRGNGARAQIAQTHKLFQELGALSFQSNEIVRHRASI